MSNLVVATMEGGIIQHIQSQFPIEFVLVDYDYGDSDDRYLTEVHGQKALVVVRDDVGHFGNDHFEYMRNLIDTKQNNEWREEWQKRVAKGLTELSLSDWIEKHCK